MLEMYHSFAIVVPTFNLGLKLFIGTVKGNFNSIKLRYQTNKLYRHIKWVKLQVENNAEVPTEIANLHINMLILQDIESVTFQTFIE